MWEHSWCCDFTGFLEDGSWVTKIANLEGIETVTSLACSVPKRKSRYWDRTLLLTHHSHTHRRSDLRNLLASITTQTTKIHDQNHAPTTSTPQTTTKHKAHEWPYNSRAPCYESVSFVHFHTAVTTSCMILYILCKSELFISRSSKLQEKDEVKSIKHPLPLSVDLTNREFFDEPPVMEQLVLSHYRCTWRN